MLDAPVEPSFIQFTGEGMKQWLSRTSGPVVLIFFWCHWREESRPMRLLLESLVKGYREVKFYWVNADEKGSICKEFSVPGAPTVLILSNFGQEEEARFTLLTSEAGIRHNLSRLVKDIKKSQKDVSPATVFAQ